MAKMYGKIYFAETSEVAPGVWKEELISKGYPMDILQNNRKTESSGGVNDDVNVSIRLSIVANPYAKLNFHKMRCAEYMGALWKITDVEVVDARLNLTLGGLYNANTT